jgi:hypothetical protein
MGASSSVLEVHECSEWRRVLDSLSGVSIEVVLEGALQAVSSEGLRSRIGNDSGEAEGLLEDIWALLSPTLVADVQDDWGLGDGVGASSRSMSRSGMWLAHRVGCLTIAAGGVRRPAVVCLGERSLLRILRGCCTSSLNNSRTSVVLNLSVEGSGNSLGSGTSPAYSASSFPASRRCIHVGGLGTIAVFSFHHLGMPRTKPSSRSFSIPGISCLNLQPIAAKLQSPVWIQCVQYSFLDGSGSMPDGWGRR